MQVICNFLGILLCVQMLCEMWERRTKFWNCVFGLFLGLGIVLSASLQTYFNHLNPGFETVRKLTLSLLLLLAAVFIIWNWFQKKKEKKTAKNIKYSSAEINTTIGSNAIFHTLNGTQLGSFSVIFLVASAVLFIGLSSPQPMIGDEVTHFYMMKTQAADLSKPNFTARIPVAARGIEVRRYPHSFGWHYLGAVVYRITNGSFTAIQIYQTLFLLQLLLVGYLLARDRGGNQTGASLAFVLTLASVPLCLIFSVAFYQDVPLTAQILSSFYFLSRRQWFVATLFMAFALFLKETALLFLPVFLFLLLYWEVRNKGSKSGVLAGICAGLFLFAITLLLGNAVHKYARTGFFPQVTIEKILSNIKSTWALHTTNLQRQEPATKQHFAKKPLHQKIINNKKQRLIPHKVIQNFPGDLRQKQNFFIYGGLLLWMMAVAGCLILIPTIKKSITIPQSSSSRWLLGVGISTLVLTAIFGRNYPDARFFLPVVPFLLLVASEQIVRFPHRKIIITFVAAFALLQGGYVLAKTYKLRHVSPELLQAVEFLKTYPVKPRKIFMYPEGNYRLFPVRADWYLRYRLREFWEADNDKRIEMLHHFGIGAIVIKKYLVARIDKQITNLGVYPVGFVRDISHDLRFKKEFENKDIVIYKVPYSVQIKDN